MAVTDGDLTTVSSGGVAGARDVGPDSPESNFTAIIVSSDEEVNEEEQDKKEDCSFSKFKEALQRKLTLGNRQPFKDFQAQILPTKTRLQKRRSNRSEEENEDSDLTPKAPKAREPTRGGRGRRKGTANRAVPKSVLKAQLEEARAALKRHQEESVGSDPCSMVPAPKKTRQQEETPDSKPGCKVPAPTSKQPRSLEDERQFAIDLATFCLEQRGIALDMEHAKPIFQAILFKKPAVGWNSIAGLEALKQKLREMVVWPRLKPDLFTGLRAPGKGLLLFGPPGTGKTMIAKCLANECNGTFISMSASSLTSKWLGESEKIVRALFHVAIGLQPTIIFIDEIDSLLRQRGSTNEHECTRRIKTEFLVQWDGCVSSIKDDILVVGATNRPEDLDEAVRRRFQIRLHVPLPDADGREAMIQSLLSKEKCSISSDELRSIVCATEGYSCADMDTVCRDAALGPLRDKDVDIVELDATNVRPINAQDMLTSIEHIPPTVNRKDIERYRKYEKDFGTKLRDVND